MDVVADLPAEPVQVGEGALDNPALGSESGAVFGAAARDQWLHSERADEVAILVVVVAGGDRETKTVTTAWIRRSSHMPRSAGLSSASL